MTALQNTNPASSVLAPRHRALNDLAQQHLRGGQPALEGEALGALLRREGLHEAQVHEWRAAAAEALSAEAAPLSVVSKADLKREVSEAKKRVAELERQMKRKDKALAEAGAMLLLEKKLQSIGWRNEDESTDGKKDE